MTSKEKEPVQEQEKDYTSSILSGTTAVPSIKSQPSTSTSTSTPLPISNKTLNATLTSPPPPPFRYPPLYNFPPFFSPQRVAATSAAQLSAWADLLLEYTTHDRVFRLTTTHTIFHNTRLSKKLTASDVRSVFALLVERGRAEWVDPKAKEPEEIWVFWRSTQDWAAMLASWVEETGHKGAVLTVYELLEGEISRGREWTGMPREMLLRSLNVLVKRGKAAVFGEGEELGVKFYG